MISPAYAQTAGTAGGFDIMMVLPFVAMFVVMYFIIIRPQQKKSQQQKNLQSSLRRGDRILTAGGIIGVVSKIIDDQEVEVEIANNVRVRIARVTIGDVLSKSEPVAEAPSPTSKAAAAKPITRQQAPTRTATKKAAPVRKIASPKAAPKKGRTPSGPKKKA